MLGDLAVALWRIQIAAALAEIHIKRMTITVTLFPRRDPAAQTVVALARQIDNRPWRDPAAEPILLALGHAQAPVQNGERLPAAARAVNHNQRRLLNPALDHPLDRRWLAGKLIRRHQPVAHRWLKQRCQIVAGLDVIIGVPGRWRHHRPGTVLGARLLGISLAYAARIVVSHDHQVLLRPEPLPKCAGDRD